MSGLQRAGRPEALEEIFLVIQNRASYCLRIFISYLSYNHSVLENNTHTFYRQRLRAVWHEISFDGITLTLILALLSQILKSIDIIRNSGFFE